MERGERCLYRQEDLFQVFVGKFLIENNSL